MEPIPQLPEDLLATLLSFVDVQQRVGSCSLVCRAWRDAAAAATASDLSLILQLQDTSHQLDQRYSCLNAWLKRHGRQTHKLTLAFTEGDGWPGGFFYPGPDERPAPPSVQLPCSQLGELQSLSISGMDLLLLQLLPDAAEAAAATAAAVAAADQSSTRRVTRSAAKQLQVDLRPQFLAGLSSLTKLQLVNCRIAGWGKGLAGLSALRHLQDLQLQHLETDQVGPRPKLDPANFNAAMRRSEQNAQHISIALAAALPHLLQLTHLSIQKMDLAGSVLQELSRLQQLHELRLKDCVEGTELARSMQDTLAHLPSSLSVLAISATWSSSREDYPVVLESSSTARLQQLGRLQQLRLPGFVLQDAAGLLGGLSQLTSLKLGYKWYQGSEPVTCPPWSKLQQLRELSTGVEQLDLLQGLPLSLTLLEFLWCGTGPVSSSTAPSIAKLTALQHLKAEVNRMDSACFCPSILQEMLQLRHLELTEIASEGLPLLLDALQNMQQMQHLTLRGDCEALEGDAMQQYAALTASSQLQVLDLYYDDHIMADGAAQFMFPEGRQLPHLTQLMFGVEDWDCTDFPQPFGKGDIARLAAACPALQQFHVLPCIHEDADIKNLSLLTSVTELKVGGWDLPARELAAALSQMSNLVDLQVTGVDYFEEDELAALTKLTGLRHLVVQAKEDQRLIGDDDWVSLHSRASPPDVWSQLRQLCLQDSRGAVALERLELPQEMSTSSGWRDEDDDED